MSTVKIKGLVKDRLSRLHALDLINQDQVESVIFEHNKTGRSLDRILIEFGFIDEEVLLSIIAEDSGVDFVYLNKILIDTNLINHFPKSLAQELSAIPLSQNGDIVTVAMSNINDVQAKQRIKQCFEGCTIVNVLASRSDIMQAIDKYYEYNTSIHSIIKELSGSKNTFSSNEATNPIVRLLDAIILDATRKFASDIHFEPERFFVRVRVRVDGILIPICVLHKNYWNQLCVRIKIVSSMDIADSIRPQGGRFSLNLFGRDIDFRVSSHPISHGENIVMRVLDKKYSLVSLKELGYSAKNYVIINKLIHKNHGMVVVTGPTGSGKTTSLYSMLSMVHSDGVNIMTLEDPIEYELPMIRQSSVQDIPGRSFADGLRSILRQDPDIIFVGEIRDAVTAEMAIRGAMTGHQVFTTLHTYDAFSSLFRLIDLGISPNLLAGNLNMVISQRLIRKLCDKCKKISDNGHSANNRFGNEIILNAAAEDCDEYTVLSSTYEAVGCPCCNHTGYSGRTCISEVLEFNDEINEMIYLKKSFAEIKTFVTKNGFISLKDDALYRVKIGQTSISEAKRVVDL
ncbi:GspE/PulE family protein [Candidatus Gromoviella agglomerans]|uniref:GspE/PulE family protein n=1 Tax=Candidatus Gromoviella agglomerans TaxID=2806609 RepID=UPI001E4B444C|nr:GspE/PulE family protein [Candidatus Gromoviella agglomerans]UFX98490.1 PulE/GspE-like type II secretion protein [Candidatus Gromoviella agglomerans]